MICVHRLKTIKNILTVRKVAANQADVFSPIIYRNYGCLLPF